MRVAARLALAALLVAGGEAGAQDSIPVRHLLALDLARMEPFSRSYEMVVYRGDSSITIGDRLVSLEQAEHAGTPGWLLVEHRSGTVPAAESLFVAADARPVNWSAWQGPARFAAVFVGDTILGATVVGGSKQNLLLPGRPDLLASAAMVELALGLLPLHAEWRDSAAVLGVDLGRHVVRPAEIVALGSEEYPADSVGYRTAHVVALRTEGRSILYWVDAETRAVVRMQQALPAHVGTVLEYRLRAPSQPAP